LRKIVVLTIVGLLALIVAMPGPAGASASGGTVYNCNVTLPVWPTTSGGAVNCNGTANGVITGSTTTGAAYALDAINSKLVGAASSYSETCGPGGIPLTGTAKGTFFVYNLKALAGPSGSATAAAPFNWSRVGSTAVITLGKGTITWNNGKIARGTSGVSVANFVVTAPQPPPTCAAPKKVNASITGVAILIS